MHTEITKERRGLNAFVGLVVAGATLMAGMLALPVSKASAYEADDEFHATLDNTIEPKLTVTKYLSTKAGDPATGSSKDKPAPGSGHTPAVGVIFNVHQVVPKNGETVADIDPTNPGTYTPVSGEDYAGETDGSGVISNWFTADSTGRPTSSAKTFPKGIHYYVMEERQDISPSFMPGGRYYGRGYNPAQNSFFSLPFRSQDGSQDPGYIYHLHLFPKNVNDSDLTKQVVNFTDGNGNDEVLAKPGDVITYRLNQRIYNEASSGGVAAGDNKLDVAELSTPPDTDLRVSDRMTTALRMDESTIDVKLVGGNAPKNLVKDTDYTVAGLDKSPNGYGSASTTPLFPTEPGAGTKYWTFEFFKSLSTIRQYATDNPSVTKFTIQIEFKATVTANGDSTAASQGSIQNTVKSTNTDKGTHENPEGRTDTPAATASFGKVDKTGKGLAGAVFRLVDPTDDSKYLASDGRTYADDSSKPANVTFYQAESNNQGAVVFSALPIMDPDAAPGTEPVGRAGDWRIEERTTPKVTAPEEAYDRPTVLFSKVSFAAPAGETEYVVGKTAKQILDHFITTPIEATHSYLSFGRYAYPNTPATPITVGGHQVVNYLTNFKHSDPDAPINLPLTGGRGIIMLLVIGLLVMGGALYARNRRNASRA